MNTQSRTGFTIIEVMLFLAVSGALTVGILIGSSAVIGQQRYRDSVNTFKGHLQEQYSHVANVINNDTQNPACSRDDDSLVFDEEQLLTRGTSECLLLGKLVFVESSNVTTYSVVGEPASNGTSVSDAAALQGYGLATRLPEEKPISWGARAVQPRTDEAMTATILIVRSPVSGSILTYVSDGDHRSTITDVIDDANMVQKDFCIDSGGMSGMQSRLAVRLGARASSPSAVEIPLESDGVCD